MQQPEETTAEAKAKRNRALGLESEGGIVKLKFLQRSTEVLEALTLYRVQPSEHHRLYFLKALDSRGSTAHDMGNSISDLHLSAGLNTRNNVANIPCADFLPRIHI